MAPERMTPDGRWWLWFGRQIDLAAPPYSLPRHVRTALLAQRDAETDDDHDMADFLVWLVEEHPPWAGGCSTCSTSHECEVQINANTAAVGWLIERTTKLVARSRARLTGVKA